MTVFFFLKVEATVNRLHAEGAKFGMIWLDIEIFAWPNDINYNRNVISAMGNQLNVSVFWTWSDAATDTLSELFLEYSVANK